MAALGATTKGTMSTLVLLVIVASVAVPAATERGFSSLASLAGSLSPVLGRYFERTGVREDRQIDAYVFELIVDGIYGQVPERALAIPDSCHPPVTARSTPPSPAPGAGSRAATGCSPT